MKTNRRIGAILAGLAGGITLLTGIPKILAVADPGGELYANFAQIGIDKILIPLIIIDILLPLVYWYRRTSALGTIAMFGFWSGAIAVELANGALVPVGPTVLALTIAAAWFRNPEFFDRLLRRTPDPALNV